MVETAESLVTLLRRAGLRPTRQRLALAGVLFGRGHRHVSAEQLHDEAQAAGVGVSQATVYNTLHRFTRAGLLREVVIDAGRYYFDTNTRHHHHFFVESTATLLDIEGEDMRVENLPQPPRGTAIDRVDVVVRVKGDPSR
jgi:Fur family iron response transcriptional regulator